MKFLKTTALLLFIAVNTNAQEAKTLHYQLSLGTNYTMPYQKKWSLLDTRHEYSGSFGYFSELLVHYNMKPKVTLRSGINYNYTQFEEWYLVNYSTASFKVNKSSLRIPLLFTYYPLKDTPISVSAGPYIGILLSAKEKGSGYFYTSELTIEDENDPVFQNPISIDNDIKDIYKNVDYGMTIELNYDFKLTPNIKSVVLTRFSYGLTDIINGSTTNFKWKNYYLDLGIGIKI